MKIPLTSAGLFWIGYVLLLLASFLTFGIITMLFIKGISLMIFGIVAMIGDSLWSHINIF